MRITINQNPIEIEPGRTVLQAARAAGVEIPTLCYQEGIEARSSCFLCAVRVEGRESLQPACAMPAEDGLVVTTDSAEVAAARKTALELLFSDHAGRCAAPCEMACPARLDITSFLRRVRQGEIREAAALVKQQLVFPAVLGRICPAYCENPCLRKQLDEAIAIRLSHGRLAENDLASRDPWLPERRPPTGKTVAIVGAGVAGLAAAWYLLQEGHACDLFDAGARPGGTLLRLSDDRLDKTVLDAEIETIMRLGPRFEGGWRLGEHGSLDELRARYDAVLVAVGAPVAAPSKNRHADVSLLRAQGLQTSEKGVAADSRNQTTNREGIFAAGEVVSGAGTVVRTVAAARRAAVSIRQYLAGATWPPAGESKPFYFVSRNTPPENQLDALKTLYHARSDAPANTPIEESRRAAPEPGDPGARLSKEGLRHEAARCLACGCAKEHTCRLRAYAAEFDINPYRFRGESRALEPDVSHAEVVFEPGKCILCGLCLKIAEEAGEEIGLSFAGRGFPTRVTVPLGATLSAGLHSAARACAEACPTGAFSLKTD